MPLSNEEVDALLRVVRLTRDDEIDCDECVSRVAEFAEQELAGRTVSEGLEAVEHHLSICEECREEYEALRRALGEIGGRLRR